MKAFYVFTNAINSFFRCFIRRRHFSSHISSLKGSMLLLFRALSAVFLPMSNVFRKNVLHTRMVVCSILKENFVDIARLQGVQQGLFICDTLTF